MTPTYEHYHRSVKDIRIAKLQTRQDCCSVAVMAANVAQRPEGEHIWEVQWGVQGHARQARGERLALAFKVHTSHIHILRM